jgi:hypothetical protein
MNKAPVGKLERVPVRQVWEHEAYDLTQWLQENIDVLNTALDLNLVNVDREQASGFRSPVHRFGCVSVRHARSLPAGEDFLFAHDSPRAI